MVAARAASKSSASRKTITTYAGDGEVIRGTPWCGGGVGSSARGVRRSTTNARSSRSFRNHRTIHANSAETTKSAVGSKPNAPSAPATRSIRGYRPTSATSPGTTVTVNASIAPAVQRRLRHRHGESPASRRRYSRYGVPRRTSVVRQSRVRRDGGAVRDARVPRRDAGDCHGDAEEFSSMRLPHTPEGIPQGRRRRPPNKIATARGRATPRVRVADVHLDARHARRRVRIVRGRHSDTPSRWTVTA